MNFGLTDEQSAILGAVRDVAKAEKTPDLSTLKQLGLFGIVAPSEFGGAGLGTQETVVCVEALAAREPSLALLVAWHNLTVVRSIASSESESRGQWLRRLASGAWLGSATAGSLVPFGARVQVVTAGTRCDFGERVVLRTPRLTGLREAGLVELGEHEGHSEATADTTPAQRLGLAAVAIGIARGALQHASRYAQERHQFGGPIARFQATQWKLADSAMAIDAARMLMLRAAWLADANHAFDREAAMALRAANRAALLSTDHAVQLHGGYGYTADFPVERLYRDARACAALLDGDAALDHVAQSLLATH